MPRRDWAIALLYSCIVGGTLVVGMGFDLLLYILKFQPSIPAASAMFALLDTAQVIIARTWLAASPLLLVLLSYRTTRDTGATWLGILAGLLTGLVAGMASLILLTVVVSTTGPVRYTPLPGPAAPVVVFAAIALLFVVYYGATSVVGALAGTTGALLGRAAYRRWQRRVRWRGEMADLPPAAPSLHEMPPGGPEASHVVTSTAVPPREAMIDPQVPPPSPTIHQAEHDVAAE